MWQKSLQRKESNMTIILIIGILYMVVGLLIILIYLFLERYNNIGWTIALTLNMAGILNVMIYDYVIKAPSALDVYKGKTVLKINYEDKVPVDTVVIYKKGK